MTKSKLIKWAKDTELLIPFVSITKEGMHDIELAMRECLIAGAKWLLAEAEKMAIGVFDQPMVPLSDLKKLAGINPEDLNLGEEE
jgi:hypothetical protein